MFRWHNFMTFMTVPVITWAGHTRHMTGPHTKYFPTYFYNPDIFCLPFISFLLTGCSQDQWDAWRVAWHSLTCSDIRKQPRKLMNVFVWSWHGRILASSASVTSGPRGQVAVTRHRVSAGASWLTLWFIFRCNKVRCPQDPGTDTHGH